MKFLSNLPLKGKLTLGFGLIVLGMLIVGILSMVQLSKVKDQASAIVTYNISGVRDALLVAESATRYRTREYRLLHTTEADRQKYLDRLPEARDTVATFSVRTNSGPMAEASPPNSRVAMSR